MTVSPAAAEVAAASPARTGPRWLRFLLIAIAAIDTLTTLPSLPAIFLDLGPQEPLIVFIQTLNRVQIVLAPILAAAAFWFAIRHRLGHAIIALATAMLVAWVTELPSMLMHGLEITTDLQGLLLVTRQLVYPVIAIAAIVMAVKRIHLPVAGILVSVPTVLGIVGMIALAALLSGGGF
jgi:hypothetical protein